MRPSPQSRCAKAEREAPWSAVASVSATPLSDGLRAGRTLAHQPRGHSKSGVALTLPAALQGAALTFFALANFCAAEDFLDRLDEKLTISTFHDQVRARLSGMVDLEFYHFDSPAPGLIFSPDHSLFNPRLTLFLDAQFGPHVYFFAQARVDRGFDPAKHDAEIRLDEYALRLTPWEDGRFNLQIGKFATIVGNWSNRHDSWENPFVTAPLPYENLTGIWDSEPPHSSEELFSWSHVSDGRGGFFGDEYADKHLRVPIVWGPAYTSGLAVSGKVGKFEYAADVKNGSLSSRPEEWGVETVQWQYPKYSARLGLRPDLKWRLGVSASVGSYLDHEAHEYLPGLRVENYRQIVIAQDVSFSWHQWQLWAEFYQARFEIPKIGNADTFAYYLEAKYKFTPQLFGAVRWNQQFFNRIDHQRWGRDLWRIDAAATYRFTPHTQLKVQYILEDEEGPHGLSHGLAAQFTMRF